MPGGTPDPERDDAAPDPGEGSRDARPGGTTPDLFGRVYDELHRLATSRMRHESRERTLQPTALVHEVYLRLMKSPDVEWQNPGHFFGAAAESMRRILVERARRRNAVKRGGGRARVPLDDLDLADEPPSDAILALDEALTEFAQQDERAAKVVEMRYFAGLSVEETAAALDVSPRTVKREWAVARAWLLQRMDEDDAPPASPDAPDA